MACSASWNVFSLGRLILLLCKSEIFKFVRLTFTDTMDEFMSGGLYFFSFLLENEHNVPVMDFQKTIHNLEQLSGHELACNDGWLYKYDGHKRTQDKKGCELSSQSADDGDRSKAKAASIDGEIRSGIEE